MNEKEASMMLRDFVIAKSDSENASIVQMYLVNYIDYVNQRGV